MNHKICCDNCSRRDYDLGEHEVICPICIKQFRTAVSELEIVKEELRRYRLKDFRELVK